MSRALRCISASSRLASSTVRPTTSIRQFHSPFVALKDKSPTAPPTSTSNISLVYEKQFDFSPEPIFLTSGKTYVVSQPDASSKFYEVPSGAYPTSVPYVNFAPTVAPDTHGAQFHTTDQA